LPRSLPTGEGEQQPLPPPPRASFDPGHFRRQS
jgi:hypothetical protein